MFCLLRPDQKSQNEVAIPQKGVLFFISRVDFYTDLVSRTKKKRGGVGLFISSIGVKLWESIYSAS